jgi:hypothetical protein
MPQQKKQATIERTLLVGAIAGLLLGILSRRLAIGLLTGIGLSLLIGYALNQSSKQDREE